MSLFEKIIFALQTNSPSPTNYGTFHLVSIGLCILVTALLCIFARDVSDRNFRIIIGVCWGLMVGFEIYKQLIFSFNGETGEWSYQWYAFPYQLCSTPLYLLPLVAFMKDGKIRNGVMTFITTFAFFGGLCVMVFPNDVFASPYLGIHIQTMVHHALQLVTGIYIAVHSRKKFDKRNFITATIVFAIALVLAMVLNIIMHFVVPDHSFNMFYISPYFECHLPILNIIDKAVPYPVFFVIYTLGFVLCAILMLTLIMGGIKGCTALSKKLKKD